jgi:hypothetical protein
VDIPAFQDGSTVYSSFFVIVEENSPYSYQTSKFEIEKILNNIKFHSLVFTNHMHHEWMFVKATK